MIDILISVMFFLLSIQFFRKKWFFLIAGYNLLSDQEKKKFDKNKLGPVLGTFCFLIGTLNLINLFYKNETHTITVAIIFIVIITVIITNMFAIKRH